MTKKMFLLAIVVPLFSLLAVGQKAIPRHAITEDEAMDMVMRIPEVKKSCAYFEKKTHGERHLYPLVYGEPDSTHRYYWIAVGEDNGMSFVTHFGFFVYIKTGKIFYYDTLNGAEIDLRTWRKRLAKNNSTKHT